MPSIATAPRRPPAPARAPLHQEPARQGPVPDRNPQPPDPPFRRRRRATDTARAQLFPTAPHCTHASMSSAVTPGTEPPPAPRPETPGATTSPVTEPNLRPSSSAYKRRPSQHETITPSHSPPLTCSSSTSTTPNLVPVAGITPEIAALPAEGKRKFRSTPATPAGSATTPRLAEARCVDCPHPRPPATLR